MKHCIVCEVTHCVQRYTVRSSFRVNGKITFPSVKKIYTSAAIDAMDKYQVCNLIWIVVEMLNNPEEKNVKHIFN